MSDQKEVNVSHNGGLIRDEEILGGKGSISHEEAVHFGALTAEEQALEKVLVKKIDFVIMPCVILVYLMNYIDR